MNLKEIFLLNLALDGKQIFSLPDFANLKMNKLKVQAITEKMIADGILSDKNCFSKDGIIITKRIEDFKKSKKYVKLGSLLLGLSDENTAVLLKRNEAKGLYVFERINVKNSISQIFEVYPFFINASSKVENVGTEKITYAKLMERYKLHVDYSVYLSTFVIANKNITDEIFFVHNNELFLYDRKEEILMRKNCAQSKNLINERMEL